MTILIICTIVLYATVTAAYFYYREISTYNLSIRHRLIAEEKLISSNIEQIQAKALSLALSIAVRSDVKQAYLIADDEIAQEELFKSITPIIDILKDNLEYDELKVHFHRPSAISLLRQWNQKDGDDLSSFRKSVLHVQETRKALTCIELGKGGFAVRGIAPIEEDGKYLGSVEVLFEIHDVITNIRKNSPDIDFIVLTSKTKMEALLFSNEKEKYYKDIWNNHIVIEQTVNPENILDAKSVINLDNNLDHQTSNIELGDTTLGILNIVDFSEETIGHFLFFFNKAENLKPVYRVIIFIIAIDFTVGLLIIILIYYFFRKIQSGFTNYSDKLKTEIEQKNRFFSIIAHDLRTPFNALIGFSRILLTDEVSELQKNKFTEAIHESSTHGLELLENLLTWSASETERLTINFQKLNLKTTTDEPIRLLKHNALQKNITIQSSISADLNVYSDPHCLNTILRNLLSNAVKFTNPGGKVLLSAKRNNEMIACSISDNGVGMSDQLRNSLFRSKLYSSTKGTENEKGAGIGLLLVKDFVEKCKGEITVISRIGEGSTFTFTLPEYKVQDCE